jgi:glycosyltransferase involved in cell wall biosynthesis
MDDGGKDSGTITTPARAAAMSPKCRLPIWFCSHVGGGVFGGFHTAAWRELGLDARLLSTIALGDYWRAKSKSGLASKLKLRWRMYVEYPLTLRRAVLRARPGEIFVVTTNPFFSAALASFAARRSGAKIVNLVYDLYPDALYFGGGWSRSNLAARFAAWTTRRAIHQCAVTVYLGERLQRHAETAYGVAPVTVVISVGTDASVFRESEPKVRTASGLRCLYSGHMGLLHDWRTLAGVFDRGLPTGVMVEIAADGPGAVQLKTVVQGCDAKTRDCIQLAGTRGDADWRAAMLSADVALVTMTPSAGKVVMPSKTYSAMAAGQAVLAVCAAGSDLANLVSTHDCGWVIAPGDGDTLHQLLTNLASAPDEVMAKRQNAFAAAHAHYSMEAVSQQWVDLFDRLNE